MLLGDRCVFHLILKSREYFLDHDLVASVHSVLICSHFEFSSSGATLMSGPAQAEAASSFSPLAPTSMPTPMKAEAKGEEAAHALVTVAEVWKTVEEGWKKKRKKEKKTKTKKKKIF